MSGRVPHDPPESEEALLWLTKAEEDAAVANLLIREEYLSPAAFHTQQALEKLLKALLLAAGEDLQRTHDLDALAAHVRRFWPAFIPNPSLLVAINRWYLESRYPDNDDVPPPLNEIAEALREIEALLVAVNSSIRA